MTKEERAVLNKLVAAWNAFNALPVEHPDDTPEFRHAFHRLQLLILAREPRRKLLAE
jgi:hypothetical protein